MHRFAYPSIGLSAVLLLSACAAPAVIAVAGGTGGYYGAQERPLGESVDDAGIRLKLNELYIEKNASDMFKNISIDVSEGRVMLTGGVEKAQTATEAVRLARTVKSVREVINEIQVTGGTSVVNYTQDGWISAQIKSRMLFDKNIRSINFTVETVNQRVYLLGIARNRDELEKVATIASTTKYVKEVISHIILQDDPRRGGNAKPATTLGQTQGAGSSPQIYNDSYDADHPVRQQVPASYEAPSTNAVVGYSAGGYSAGGNSGGDNAADSTSMYGNSYRNANAGGSISSSDLPPPAGR